MNWRQYVLIYIFLGWYWAREDMEALYRASMNNNLHLGVMIGVNIVFWPVLGLFKGVQK